MLNAPSTLITWVNATYFHVAYRSTLLGRTSARLFVTNI